MWLTFRTCYKDLFTLNILSALFSLFFRSFASALEAFFFLLQVHFSQSLSQFIHFLDSWVAALHNCTPPCTLTERASYKIRPGDVFLKGLLHIFSSQISVFSSKKKPAVTCYSLFINLSILNQKWGSACVYTSLISRRFFECAFACRGYRQSYKCKIYRWPAQLNTKNKTPARIHSTHLSTRTWLSTALLSN